MKPVTVARLPSKNEMSSAGVYLFSENGNPLYVGRTNGIRKRLREHTYSSHNSAPFAFRLARDAAGKLKATYTKKGSRKELEQCPEFGPKFKEMTQRVKNMDVQFVEESDPMRQALLEMYVSISLQTPHNDFDNH